MLYLLGTYSTHTPYSHTHINKLMHSFLLNPWLPFRGRNKLLSTHNFLSGVPTLTVVV